MTTVSDSAGGSGALGVTEVGGLPFVEFPAAGSFTRASGFFKPMGSDAANPIGCVDLGWGDVDVSLNVSPSGGDALYFRVLDAGNWWRARVYAYSTSSTYPNGTYTVGSYRFDYTATASPGEAVYNPGTYYGSYVGPYPRSMLVNNSTNHTYTAYWRDVTENTSTSYSTVRQVIVDRCLNGSIATQKTYSTGAVLKLRAVAQGTQIQVYATSGTTESLLGTLTSSDLKGATRHGFGRAPSSNSGTSLDNLAITTLGDPPNAPQLVAPVGGAVVNDANTNRLQWAFSGGIGDKQSKAELRYRIRDVGAPWTTVTIPSPAQFWDAPPATFTPGAYEWQVTTYGTTGLASPPSPSAFFTAADPVGKPIITYPAAGGSVDQNDRIDWSAPDQVAFRVQRVADNAGVMADPTVAGNVYFDTGEVVADTRSRPLTFETKDRPEWLRVQVQGANLLWSDWSDPVRVDVSYTPPAAPVVLYMQPLPVPPRLMVGILNPAPAAGEPDAVSNDVYLSSDVDPEWPAARGLAPGEGFTYWFPAGGRNYYVRVVTHGSNGTTASSVTSDGVQAAINDGAWI